ncbi:MAG: DoxX family protein [Patescibacteria group bacterium]
MIPFNRAYEAWAPVVARLLLAIQFAAAAAFKIMGFSGEVAQTAAAGVPIANIAVAAALLLEIVGVVALVLGWRIRLVSMLLAGYVALLAVIFYHDWSTPMGMGLFISHLGLIAALLYVSVYGARHFAISRD